METEVDRSQVAGQRVMRSIGGGSPEAPPEKFTGALGGGSGGLWRQMQRGYGNQYVGQVIQRKCDDCEKKEERIQRKGEGNVSAVPDGFEAAMQQSGSGQPLDDGTRSFMESRFGQDFGDVQIHTDSAAADAAKQIQAQAFTTERDIYFGQGRYQPKTTAGQKLLAHELTHVVQQKPGARTNADWSISSPQDASEQEAEAISEQIITASNISPSLVASSPVSLKQIARNGGDPPTPIPPVNTQVSEDAVNTIIKALKGITTSSDSAAILSQFQGKDAGTVRSILQGLKNRASAEGETPEGMIDWLFGDMTAEDSRELRRVLIAVGVVEDLARIVAQLVKNRLSGYTSESDSLEIYTALAEFGGTKLDAVLNQLQTLTGKGEHDMSDWLFGDMDRVNAERLRQYFFNSGSTPALAYAANWTANKIESLLSGYTSRADSNAIVWNFSNTPTEFRIVVQERLNELTTARWGQSAEDALMEDMKQSGYEELRAIGGLRLRPYDYKPSGWEQAVGVVEWGSIVAEWVVCGVVGIITGVLSSIWEIVKGLWDIVVAAWHLLWSLIYLISGGSAGSENWLAVKDFFRGLAKLFDKPGELWDQYWEELKLEFNTIEGAFTDCRQAEFIVRKFINAIVNIILIFVGGYGLVKGAVSAAKGLAEFTALVREVGALRALVQVAVRAGGTIRTFVAETAETIEKIAAALRQPVQTLVSVGRRINVLILAAREEGVWSFLRKQKGVLTESEKKFWQEQKDYWRTRAEGHQTKHAELSDEVGTITDNLGEQKAPQDADKVVNQLSEDAKKIEKEVGDLEDDVVSPERAPAPTHEAGVNRSLETIQHAVCGFCFPAGTKLLTRDGYINIEAIRPGDWVLARDESLQSDSTYKKVLETFQNITDSLLEVTIGSQKIKTTLGHVWWIEGKGWILAQELEVGDLVLTSDGSLLTITAVQQINEFAITYNCEVDDYHTYFVAADEGLPGIWVHNQSLGVRVLRPDQVYQLIMSEIVIKGREAIRRVIGTSLEATGSYSTELRGLYAYLRQGRGAGFQGVTADAINRLEIVLKNLETKGGGVVAAIDLEQIGANRVFELSDPKVLSRLMEAYPRFENMFSEMASEGVVAVRGKIPARAVQSLVNIPEDLSKGEKEIILQELLKPCKR
jgi:hypothetical protein